MSKHGDIIEIQNFKGTREQLLRRYPQLALRHQSRVETDKGELDGLWICGRHLDEDFSIGETYETREEAIAGAADELGYLSPGDHFHTGQLSYVRAVPGLPTDGDRLIEDVGENMAYDWSEASIENWTDKATAVQADLEVNLEKAWDEWAARHNLELTGYTCEHVEQHQLQPVPNWAHCEEPAGDSDGVRACAWEGEIEQCRRIDNGVLLCPNCGSSAIRETHEERFNG